MSSLDWTVFRWLNGQAGDHAWLDHLGKFAATKMEFVIVGTLIAGWLLAVGLSIWRERRIARGLLTAALVAGIALGLGLLADQLIGQAWFRDRPYASHATAHLIEPPSSDPSFPSDHATAGLTLTLGVAVKLPLLAAVLFTETLLMSAGRVFVGLHYPGDMLGSAGVAAGAALIAWGLVERATFAIDWVVGWIDGVAERHSWPVRLE